MNDYKDIKDVLNIYLTRKDISTDILQYLNESEIEILKDVGVPSIQDFIFDKTLILLEKNSLLIMGFLSDKSNLVCINLNNHEICLVLNNNLEHKIFLAKTLKQFIFQIYQEYYFWNILIPASNFQYDKFEAAAIFEQTLKKIDEELFLKDTGYYWGSKLESIEHGLVGTWRHP